MASEYPDRSSKKGPFGSHSASKKIPEKSGENEDPPMTVSIKLKTNVADLTAAHYARMNQRLEEVNDEIQREIKKNEDAKSQHKKWMQERKLSCHALAKTLCLRNRTFGSVLIQKGLEIYMPTSVVDLHLNELEEELRKSREHLKTIEEQIEELPKRQIECQERYDFFATLNNAIFTEIKYDKFQPYCTAPKEPPKVYGGVDNFLKAMEKYEKDLEPSTSAEKEGNSSIALPSDIENDLERCCVSAEKEGNSSIALPSDIESDLERCCVSAEKEEIYSQASSYGLPEIPEYIEYPRLPKARGFKPYIPKEGETYLMDS